MRRIAAVMAVTGGLMLAACGGGGDGQTATTEPEATPTTEAPTTTTDPERLLRRYASELAPVLGDLERTQQELDDCAFDTVSGDNACSLRGPLVVLGAGLQAETITVTLDGLQQDEAPPEEIADLIADLRGYADQVTEASDAWDEAGCTWPPSGTCAQAYGDVNGPFRLLGITAEKLGPYLN